MLEWIVPPKSVVVRSSNNHCASNMSEISNVSSTNSTKIGRPVGTIEVRKLEKKRQIIVAKNKISQKDLLKYNDAKK